MSEKGMQILQSRKSLPGLKQIDLEFCENCVYGKQKRAWFLILGKEKKSEKFIREILRSKMGLLREIIK